jgi:hypothetical protein
MKYKEELDKRITSLKMQLHSITADIEQKKKIRKDMSDRLFDAEVEKSNLNDVVEKEKER